MPRPTILPPWKAFVLGVVLMCSLPAVYATWIAPRIVTGNLSAEISRMIEGAAPLFLLGTLGLAIGLALLRLRRSALLLALMVGLGGLSLGLRVADLTQPLQPGTPALRVLWWNIYGSNPRPASELLHVLLDQDADVVIVGEAQPLRPVLSELRARYPYHLGCDARLCDMLVLSRHPLEAAAPRFSHPYLGSGGWIDNERLAVVKLTTAQGPVTLIGAHLTKAWYGSAHRAESHKLRRVLRRLSGPLLVIGDFNAAPWGAVISELAHDSGLRLASGGPATWPAPLHDAGIAIDHVLLRGGAGLSALESFADDHGSNHRGLLASVTLETEIRTNR